MNYPATSQEWNTVKIRWIDQVKNPRWNWVRLKWVGGAMLEAESGSYISANPNIPLSHIMPNQLPLIPIIIIISLWALGFPHISSYKLPIHISTKQGGGSSSAHSQTLLLLRLVGRVNTVLEKRKQNARSWWDETEREKASTFTPASMTPSSLSRLWYD